MDIVIKTMKLIQFAMLLIVRNVLIRKYVKRAKYLTSYGFLLVLTVQYLFVPVSAQLVCGPLAKHAIYAIQHVLNAMKMQMNAINVLLDYFYIRKDV